MKIKACTFYFDFEVMSSITYEQNTVCTAINFNLTDVFYSLLFAIM